MVPTGNLGPSIIPTIINKINLSEDGKKPLKNLNDQTDLLA